MKNLKILIIGEGKLLLQSIELIQLQGHTVVGCVNKSIKGDECWVDKSLKYYAISELNESVDFDYAIVLDDIYIEPHLIYKTGVYKWIRLLQKFVPDFQNSKPVLSSLLHFEHFFWYTYRSQSSEILRITQNHVYESENNFDNILESLHILLIDLGRGDLKFNNLYFTKTITLPSDIIDKLNINFNPSKINIKILLAAAFNVLLSRYFPFTYNEYLRIGILTDKDNESSLDILRTCKLLFIPENNNLSFIDYVLGYFKDILITIPQNNNLLRHILDNNKKNIELSLSTNTTDTIRHCRTFICRFDEIDDNNVLVIQYIKQYHSDYLINNFMHNFINLLIALTESNGSTVDKIPFIPELKPQAPINYEGHQTVINLIDQIARNNPQHVAVIYQGQSMTYQQLQANSNIVAQNLLKTGINKENVIGVMSERSIEFISIIIGIMKTGACYLPIDPNLPIERVDQIIRSVQAKTIVIEQLINAPVNIVVENLLSFDELLKPISNIKNNLPAVQENDLCYILFTSGTTGKPKGVMIEHGGLVDRLLWVKNKFSIANKDVVLHHTNISFDVSIEEIFLPLISAGTLVLAPRDIHERITDLGTIINDYKVTLVEFVPSLLKLFINLSDIISCHSLKYVISGGEPLSYELSRKFYQLAPHCLLINLYGPTESTINAAYYICDPHEVERTKYVPIGFPINNLNFYVLDQNRAIVPFGGVGELYLKGHGLARSYIRENSVIEDCCVLDKDLQRIYQTGDLVRYLDNNALEFIGRVDRQIKLRGYRIELEEIETVILKYPLLNQAAVILYGKNEISKRIVVFVSFLNENSEPVNIIEEKLKEFCIQNLPHYMVPSMFYILPTLPILASGKIDYTTLRFSLEENQVKYSSVDYHFVNKIEKIIYEVWSEILGEKIPNFDANFFNLGGNSLSAVQMISLLSAKGVYLSVGDIFEDATISSLAKKSSQKNIQSIETAIIKPINTRNRVALSYAQQRLWYLYQLEGGQNSAYNMPMIFRLNGVLNFDYLEKAINKIIQRHEVLRTIFKSENGEPWQEVLPIIHAKLDLVEVTEATLQDSIIDEIHQPFNIETGPLARYKLLELNKNCNIFVITMHNIITDGWSEGVFINELNTIYNAQVNGVDDNLSNLTLQYVDYAAWQKHKLNVDKQKSDLPYWINKLQGFTELRLFPDVYTEVDPKVIGQDIKIDFYCPALMESLHKLAQEKHTSPYVILVAAFNTVLSFYSNQEDIIFGSGFAGRNVSALENLIGFFVNTIVLRNDLSNNPTFNELIDRVKVTCNEAQQYQDVPFEQIVDSLYLEREENKNPIFQILFILQKYGDTINLELQGIECSNVVVNRKTSTFDITFNLMMGDKEFSGEVQYNSKLFSKEFVQDLLDKFYRILNILVTNPDSNIKSIDIMDKADLELILNSWNSTDIVYNQESIHTLFEIQAETFPKHIALSYQDENITYENLNKRANQLAYFLKNKLEMDTSLNNRVVGIYIKKGIDYVVSMLAILKIGSAFLPLDPEYPIERLNYYIENSEVNLVVCKSDTENLSLLKVTNLVTIDNEIKQIEANPIGNLAPISADLCYIIYTSGSTGVPKGVEISHSAVNNLLKYMCVQLNFTPYDRMLSLTSINFDIVYLELLLPLVCGGSCIIASPNIVKDPILINELITKSNPTFLQATPSFWSIFINTIEGSFKNISILTGGEILHSKIAQELCIMFKEVWNVYGPTESTIWSTIKKISDPAYITIGTPIANTKCYILDKYLKPLPVGVIGELYIAGKGLAIGYSNKPDLTNSVFLENPFIYTTDTNYKKMYRTGDLVRYTRTGEIQYIGRNDQQIKVRGHRIELLEIEAHILKHESIKEAVVIYNEEVIIAYCVPHNTGLKLDFNQIQGFLCKFLPSYMIPNKWYKIEQVPRTNNGKTDRKSLLSNVMKESHLEIPSDIIPSTEVQVKLLTIWNSVLKTNHSITLIDSFFMIGGHSLLIPPIVSCINLEFSIQMTIRDFIINNTLLKLADYVEKSLQ